MRLSSFNSWPAKPRCWQLQQVVPGVRLCAQLRPLLGTGLVALRGHLSGRDIQRPLPADGLRLRTVRGEPGIALAWVAVVSWPQLISEREQSYASAAPCHVRLYLDCSECVAGRRANAEEMRLHSVESMSQVINAEGTVQSKMMLHG
jgi:hypothetical protein